MAVEQGYKIAVVIVDQHEPEGATAGRLLEIADEKGYSFRVVEAQRGEHDAALSFRVPQDVADEFNADRSDRWPDDSAKRAELGTVPDEAKIENETEKAPASSDTTPGRKERTGKEPKE